MKSFLIFFIVCLVYDTGYGYTDKDTGIRIGDVVQSSYSKSHVTLPRTPRTRGKYLGCFQDNFLQRALRGYFGYDNNLTIEKCIDTCTFYRFVYAGFHGSYVIDSIHDKITVKMFLSCIK